jgi:hypothetical protein
MYLLYTFPPELHTHTHTHTQTHFWLPCSNLFNPSKKIPFGSAANRNKEKPKTYQHLYVFTRRKLTPISWTLKNIYTCTSMWIVDVLNVKFSVFWNITPCSPLKGYRRFGGTYRLRFRGRRISRARNQRESKWKTKQSAQVKITLRLTVSQSVNRSVLVSSSIWCSW